MARIWKEFYDPDRHHDRMPALPGVPHDAYWKDRTLQRYDVYFVKVRGFVFEFHSIAQLRACLAYYQKKTRPSSRLRFSEEDRKIFWVHWKAQRWFERLPMHPLEERNRVPIVKALTDALSKFQIEPNKAPEPTSGTVTRRAGARRAPVPPVAHL